MLIQILMNENSLIVETKANDAPALDILISAARELRVANGQDTIITTKEIVSFTIKDKTYTTVDGINKQYCVPDSKELYDDAKDISYDETIITSHCGHIKYSGNKIVSPKEGVYVKYTKE